MEQVSTSWLRLSPSKTPEVASAADLPSKMEYTGPGSLADVGADLALSDDDVLSQEHWTRLGYHGH